MPSQSKQQQKFMGMVHALKKGDIKPSDVSQSVKDAAKSMSKKDAKDFASTKHKNLPRKVKQEILDKLKEYASKMGTNTLGGDDYTTSRKGGLRDFDGYDNVDYNKDMPMDEGMFSTIDQIRQDSKNVRDFVKNVFKDRDFMKMKNDKEFIKYLKSVYEGVQENIEEALPQNWMQGRTSDYHTKLRGKKRKYDDTNFKKDNSGQPDIEEGFDKVEHLQLLNKALRAMPGSQKQKDIIRKLNKVRKAGGMRPLKEKSIVEYASKLTLSYMADKDSKLDGTPEDKMAIDEIGLFPVQNYIKGIIPSNFINTTTRDKKERLKSTLKDLKNTLNHFWKQHKIPYRIK